MRQINNEARKKQKRKKLKSKKGEINKENVEAEIKINRLGLPD